MRKKKENTGVRVQKHDVEKVCVTEKEDEVRHAKSAVHDERPGIRRSPIRTK